MGTISQRKLADGTIRFRAEIRISRKGLANFKESKTFSSMRLAQKWLAMREEEIEENPEILLGRSDVTNITLANAIEKYLDEVGNQYGRTKTYCLRLIQKFPIAQHIITKIKQQIFQIMLLCVRMAMTNSVRFSPLKAAYFEISSFKMAAA